MAYMGDSQQWGDGWVYAVQEDGTPLVKIGHTGCANLRTRWQLLQYQFRVPMTIVAGVCLPSMHYAMEQAIHTHLAPFCIQSEWFYLHMNQRRLEALVEERMPYALASQHTREFGLRLLALRKHYGWNRHQLSYASGLSFMQIGQIERNDYAHRCVSAKTLVRLAHAFCASPEYVLGVQTNAGEHQCSIICRPG